MKRFFYLSVLVILSSLNSCKKANVENGVNEKFAIMTFTKSEYDFGTINQGDKVETEFPFTNTGKVDLLITNAKGSCGCTIPDFPKKPIKPGEKGKIFLIIPS